MERKVKEGKLGGNEERRVRATKEPLD